MPSAFLPPFTKTPFMSTPGYSSRMPAIRSEATGNRFDHKLFAYHSLMTGILVKPKKFRILSDREGARPRTRPGVYPAHEARPVDSSYCNGEKIFIGVSYSSGRRKPAWGIASPGLSPREAMTVGEYQGLLLTNLRAGCQKLFPLLLYWARKRGRQQGLIRVCKQITLTKRHYNRSP